MGYNYNYHSGANVSIWVGEDNFARRLGEAVGISYSVIDSATPIYGYSSRLFDAVAPGQKIVQGSFVINYVKGNYVFDRVKAAESGLLNDIGYNNIKEQIEYVESTLAEPKTSAKDKKLFQKELKSLRQQQADFKKQLANNNIVGTPGHTKGSGEIAEFVKDPTLIGPITIRINISGAPTWIRGVFIIGYGTAIQIDENVILEEYNFIGRDIIRN